MVGGRFLIQNQRRRQGSKQMGQPVGVLIEMVCLHLKTALAQVGRQAVACLGGPGQDGDTAGGRKGQQIAIGRSAGGRDDRQGEKEGRTAARIAGGAHTDRAAMLLDQKLADRQAQAQAAIARLDRALGTMELAKDAFLLGGRNADAGIGHRHGRLAVGGLDSERNRSGCRELTGVADQVEDDLMEPRPVAEHPGTLPGQRCPPGQTSFFGHLLADLGRCMQDLGQVERLAQQAQLPGFAAGQIQDIADQLPQVLGVGVDPFHVVEHDAGQLRFAALLAEDHVAQTDDQRQRRPQFVTDDRQEAALEPVGFFGQLPALERIAIELAGAKRRGEVVDNRGAGLQVGRAQGDKAGGALVDHQRQDGKLKGGIRGIEPRRREFPRGEMATDRTCRQAGVEQDRAIGQGIVFARRIERDEGVIDAQVGQMAGKDIGTFSSLARGQQLGGHQPQAVGHLHVAQQGVGRLALDLIGDREASTVDQQVGKGQARPRRQGQQVGRPRRSVESAACQA